MRHTKSITAADRAGIGAAVGSLLLSSFMALSCVGPFVAISIGLSGFGHFTQYAALRAPASLLTLGVLALGFYWLYGRRSAGCSNAARRASRLLYWLSAAIAVAINLLEYIVLPRLYG